MGIFDSFRTFGSALRTGAAAFNIARRADSLPQKQQAQAQTFVKNVQNFAAAVRSAPVAPHEMNLGQWQPYDATHHVNPALAAAMRSKEARRARTTSGAGQEPLGFAPMPEITLASIANAQRLAHRTGWVNRKVDIDSRFVRDSSHLGAIDRKLRAWAYKAPLRVRPRTATPLSYLVATSVHAMIDQLDGLSSSIDELGSMACHGFACGELVWRDCDLSIPVGKNRSVRVPLEIISSIEEVGQRNFAFDIVDGSAWLCLGANQHVPVSDEYAQKFIYVRGPGSGPDRFRGYGWANAPLSYLDGLTLEKFGTLVEIFGLATPYLQRDETSMLSDDEHAHALSILEDLGKAQPAVIPTKYGKLDHSPVPSGLAPIHAQMLGYIKTEQSKMALGSTLSVEIGSNGSYAAANVHADGLVDTQRIYSSLTADAFRSQPVRWFLQANSERLAAAFNRYVPGGCSPQDIENEAPIIEWVLSDETPAQRLAVFQGVRGLDLKLDEEQVRQELGVLAPLAIPELLEPPIPNPQPTPTPPAQQIAAQPTPGPGATSERPSDAAAQ